MIHTLAQQWVSLSVIVFVAAASTIYLQIVQRHLAPQYWDDDWRNEHQLMVNGVVILPAIVAWAPTVEELIFRLPLLWFAELSSVSVGAIVLTTTLFSLTHLQLYVGPGFVPIPRHAGARWTADPNVRQANKRDAIFSFAIGLAAGLLVVITQQLWTAVVAHLATNVGATVYNAVGVAKHQLAQVALNSDKS